MSRRTKESLPPIIIPGIGKKEYGLKNYLNINGIYRGNYNMQDLIINSFYNQYNMGSNDDDWKIKVNAVHAVFGRFAQYAQNIWRNTQ